jgi:hypothetical protein
MGMAWSGPSKGMTVHVETTTAVPRRRGRDGFFRTGDLLEFSDDLS